MSAIDLDADVEQPRFVLGRQGRGIAWLSAPRQRRRLSRRDPCREPMPATRTIRQSATRAAASAPPVTTRTRIDRKAAPGEPSTCLHGAHREAPMTSSLSAARRSAAQRRIFWPCNPDFSGSSSSSSATGPMPSGDRALFELDPPPVLQPDQRADLAVRHRVYPRLQGANRWRGARPRLQGKRLSVSRGRRGRSRDSRAAITRSRLPAAPTPACWPDQLRARFPWLNADGHRARQPWLERRRLVRQYGLLQGLRRAGAPAGVDYVEDEVIGLQRENGRVTGVRLKSGEESAAARLSTRPARAARGSRRWLASACPSSRAGAAFSCSPAKRRLPESAADHRSNRRVLPAGGTILSRGDYAEIRTLRSMSRIST